MDSGRSTQMGMGKNVRPADSRRKIRTGRGGDERKWQGRHELGRTRLFAGEGDRGEFGNGSGGNGRSWDAKEEMEV